MATLLTTSLPVRARTRLEACGLLEQILQHGRGIGGPGLPALDGALKVLDASAALPDLFKLSGQDLSPTLPSQTRLLQIQLTHLHVILASYKKDGWLVRVEFHLPSNPRSIKMGIPPALFLVLRVFVLVSRADERDAEETLLSVHLNLLLPGRKLSCRVLLSIISNRLGSPLLCFSISLLVLGFPGMVHFQSPVKFFSACCQELNVTRSIDCVT